MYIHRVVLENIRPFESLDLSFAREDGGYSGLGVVLGDNAAGKSTLLRAVALALAGPQIARVLVPTFAGWLRRGSHRGFVQVELAFDEQDRFAGGGKRPTVPFPARLELVQRGADVELSQGEVKGSAAARGPWALDQPGWFAAAYGPFRRLFGSSPDAARLMAIPGRAPRFATLFREDATLAEATAWLQDLQFKSLEGQGESQELLAQVTQLLNDDFLRHGFRISRVSSDGLKLVNADGAELPLSDMSDGYRAALALLIDLVRHMTRTFRGAPLCASSDGVVQVSHPGVVLIDEVDAHLHPAWQRVLGEWLRQRFPKVQFICSTHSAFVAQAADPGVVVRLGDPTGATPTARLSEAERLHLVRATPDEVLRGPAFGLEHTRSPQAVKERDEYSALRARERQRIPLNPQERSRLQQLELFWDKR